MSRQGDLEEGQRLPLLTRRAGYLLPRCEAASGPQWKGALPLLTRRAGYLLAPQAKNVIHKTTDLPLLTRRAGYLLEIGIPTVEPTAGVSRC